MPLFDNLCVVGAGLIGSSVLRRARLTPGITRHLTLYDHSAEVRARAEALNLADQVCDELIDAVASADCVMLAIPVGAIGSVAGIVLPTMKKGSILTDVGSTRLSVYEAVKPHLRPDIAYVPAHPMAGTEHSGPDAGFASLFEGRWCLITPPPSSDAISIARIEALWKAMGAQTRQMDSEHHDRICAMVSHLPHLIAFTICNTANHLADEMRAEVLDYAASGFRDFTRIAASDPIMWRDIFLNNRDALLEILEHFRGDLERLVSAIRSDNSETIVATIEKGREIRRGLIENHQA